MAKEEKLLRELSNNGLLKAPLRKLLSRTSRGRKRSVRVVIFQLFRYQRLSYRFSVARDLDLMENKEEFTQAQEVPLKRMEESEELLMSWWRMCTDVSPLQLKEAER